jgi:hypothetical protein
MAYLLSPPVSIRDYIGQFLIGDILATAAAVLAGVAVQHVGASAVIIAITASAAETFVWYLYLLLHYVFIRHDPLSKALLHLVSDFGLAEAIDTIVVRPLLMYVMPMLTHNQVSGIISAKILADLLYTTIGVNRQRHRGLN